jgi:ribonuclease HI
MDLTGRHYYAVKKGKNPGIYTTWADCRKEVEGYSSVKFKKFRTVNEAIKYLGEEYPNIIDQVNKAIPASPYLQVSSNLGTPYLTSTTPASESVRSIATDLETSPNKFESPNTTRKSTDFKRLGSIFTASSQMSQNDDSSIVRIYIEGHCTPNPGDSGFGIVFMNPENVEILRAQKFIGLSTCPKASYNALICALELAMSRGFRNVEVYSNLEVIVKQMKGHYKVKELGDLYRSASNLTKNFKYIDILYIPKKSNTQAFSLAEEAIRAKPQDLTFC